MRKIMETIKNVVHKVRNLPGCLLQPRPPSSLCLSIRAARCGGNEKSNGGCIPLYENDQE